MPTADADAHARELGAQAVEAGVRIGFVAETPAVTAAILVTRDEARAFARGLLAKAGDATERTYPHPPIEVSHG